MEDITSDFDAFDFHTPNDTQSVELIQLRTKAKEMRALIGQLHKSREASLALTKLEETLMWANKAVFR
jgi:hypothetical protein